MKNQRIKQISLSLCVVLSLLISSISVCGCSHLLENNSAKSSCHEHSEMPMTMEMPAESNQAETIQNVIFESHSCNCAKPAPKVYSKSELLKIEKYAAEISPATTIEVEMIPQIIPDNPANFVQPFQLSDSSYNIKSPRAPPVL